ncbi:fas apoptotic inhibitory molecule 1 [Anabrus simplex]|uniref:fas apoptotic inhibitory molecule 1 n=1 Tax=Anabrus simplex TaxID=316456 RepID=UPI0034DDA8CB
MSSGNNVAYWEVPMSDGLHRIEFEHGTTSGKRVVKVDGKEIIRRDWMFKLVGDEVFNVGQARCTIRVEPVGGFSYAYELDVNGKSYESFTEFMNKSTKTWIVNIGNETYRVVLEKDTLDIWANGQKLETMGEFVEDGTETHFTLGDTPAYIKAVTSGKRREGILHNLIINDTVIAEARVH